MSDDQNDIEGEERGIYMIVGAACLPIVIAVLADSKMELDGGNVIAFGIVILAAFGLFSLLKRRERVPRARIVKR
ncbi:MAG TPA: hypothetical protein VGM39_12380 [Kofleriaceae bacterium]|jgi:hypothetical protein